MVEDEMKEVVLEEIDSIIKKTVNSEEFTNNEVVSLVTAKVIIEREVGD